MGDRQVSAFRYFVALLLDFKIVNTFRSGCRVKSGRIAKIK
jgi:hypothetical protein